ncbi:ABC transporter ATP-binding protein [Salidesulfovibrio brasiliensis]|uniref:ABC transporter ATP-binding protein n=1 Tax=Salidesulfovibrio brasiliensis TaxID=221711 RepID=UPI0006CF30E8|nr:ABC transporter ATP-binding protein [Salidesulfovibrio brasiliensis]
MLQARNIDKFYGRDLGRNQVLKDVDITVEPGEFLAVTGRSGSGKSTLLNVLSAIMRPDAGSLEYQGRDVTALGARELDTLRANDFAMVFQAHHLLPYLTAAENVLLPAMRSLRPAGGRAMKRAYACLEKVGLAGKEDRLPGALSGGECQRVAIARALAKNSRVLFADEPTGSLDRQTGDGVMDLLAELPGEGMTVVMVTHEADYAARAHRCVTLDNGRVVAA